MREIKFRAWWTEQNSMVTDEQIKLGWSVARLSDPTFKVMQFTGLKDKNGKEIYEGDVVQLSHSAEEYTGLKGKIEWCESGCCGGWRIQFIGIGNNERFAKYAEISEIVGNIFENPDLLA